MKARNFLKPFLGAHTVMADDEFVMIMTRVLGTFSLVVQTALMALNAPPTTIFLYEDISTTLKLVEKRR